MPNPFLILLIVFAFIVGHDFKAKEVCEKNGGKFSWDFGTCTIDKQELAATLERVE